MEYELKHKYAVEAAAAYLADTDKLLSTSGISESLYMYNGIGEGLYGFNYSMLYDQGARDMWTKVINHPSRVETMPRIYNKCLAVAGFTGVKFIDELTVHMIDCIARNAITPDMTAKQQKKTLESHKATLERFFKEHACLWFCILIHDVYKHNQVNFIKKLETAASTRTAVEAMR